MRIGIDMRMAGTGEGIARYVEELAKHLAMVDKQNQYFLIGDEKFLISNFKFLNNFKIIKTRSEYYSWAEQTKFIWELKKLKLDLVHFPSFNAPIFYPGEFICTIHDVIHHLFPGKKKSRWFHRLAYRLTISSTIRRAKKIIAVSHATKKDILKSFRINPEKVVVIYEGAAEKYFSRLSFEEIKKARAKFKITKPYLLFVGVWRQYKNIQRLVQAFDILKEKYNNDIELVLAGKIDPFYPEIKEAVFKTKNLADIRILGFVDEQDLLALYQGAQAFILPSLIEGFGLVGIEAQASGTPVIASEIPVLREILGTKGAWFFNPCDPNDMACKIQGVLINHNLKDTLTFEGLTNAKKFTWRETAKRTLGIYKANL